MTDTPPTTPITLQLQTERRLRKLGAARAKAILSMASTLAYGMLAAAVWKPVAEGTHVTPGGFLEMAGAVALLAGTVLMIPFGEYDDRR